MEHINVAVIGIGNMGSAHAACIAEKQIKGMSLTAVCDISEKKLAMFAEKYPDGCPVRGVAEGKDSKAVYLLNPQQVMQWMADLSMHIGRCKQAGWAKQAEVDAQQIKVDTINTQIQNDQELMKNIVSLCSFKNNS